MYAELPGDPLADSPISFTSSDERHCTDCCSLLMFVIFLLGWLLIMGVALARGDPETLLYGRDSHGQVCGSGANAGKDYLYYPQASTSSLGIMGSRALCVGACPKKGDIISTVDGNITVPFTTKNVFYRCIEEYQYYEIPVVQCLETSADKSKVPTMAPTAAPTQTIEPLTPDDAWVVV